MKFKEGTWNAMSEYFPDLYEPSLQKDDYAWPSSDETCDRADKDAYHKLMQKIYERN